MKTTKKILLICVVIIIIAGMFLLGKNGFNYADGYTKNILLDTAKTYIPYVGISTLIIIIYFAIRYYKQGIIKVLATSILGMLGAILFTISVITISKMPVTKIIFSIIIGTYVASILAITANFEEKA